MDRRPIKSVLVLFAALAATPASFAQQSRSAIASSDVLSQISMFKYRDGPKSDFFLRGTPIAANAQGSAEVEYQNGNAQIALKAWNLPDPASLGPYTTYIVWALTPDGRAMNQGVLASLERTRANSRPVRRIAVRADRHGGAALRRRHAEHMIMLYNVADDVEGKESKVTTLGERNDYSALAVVPLGDEPLELAQARYAVAIARAAGADRFAPQQYASATQKLTAAETALAAAERTARPPRIRRVRPCSPARMRAAPPPKARPPTRSASAPRRLPRPRRRKPTAQPRCRPGRICVIG